MTTPMRIELAEFEQDDPGARGEAHGELWRSQIHELCAIRGELLLRHDGFTSASQIDELAARHLPVLAAEAPALALELAGIARGAGVTLAQLVVLNHYTDLRELPAALRDEAVPIDRLRSDDPGGCTAVYLPGAARGPVLGQTWDTHGSAWPYVRLLRIRPRSGDEEVLCFTLTGCLGLMGVAASGLAITTNNLFTTDGRIGLLSSAVVRTLLVEPSAATARVRLARMPLGGGHNFMLADGRDFFGIECSARLQVLMQSGAGAAHLHTDHCFDPVLRQRERVPASSTSFRRMELATTLYVQQRPRDAAGLWALLASHEGHPRSLCSHGGEASGDAAASRTCGVMVMNLVGGEVLAGAGCAQANPPRQLGFTRWRGLEENIR
ncbi:MAG: hypothetical protein IPO88_16560 [Nannocystis sp.]|uniref:C45 family autoproteolytic acyltransferase/hydolase n=1 Tax=Nannocystis sp. TaxID=1962667 RepID=UPI002425C0E5|nr:C45 family peptidase [Nannocystis sp.]MBK9755078.1 hypothetical protein [Nannocystis sp.]